ncbi:RNA polymerase II C-terminal domain phosphatase-like 4 [Abrus precatorius]|uniref:protein-serine/threonine phosphatase n=1 Tax=Abrus precatorius TaxID=3816 RepID=A0A8B8MJL6_ABRPR|nr:RNA polymerase II C-terminal domain phosphatase-like 4 [Abrus precatorius]
MIYYVTQSKADLPLVFFLWPKHVLLKINALIAIGKSGSNLAVLLMHAISHSMSVVTDSPVHSSSSDDFIAYLDAALDANSPDSSTDKQPQNQDEFESLRIKRRKLESVEESEGTTSKGINEQNLVVAEASMEADLCTHPGSFGNMCIRCGQKLDGESGVTFGYIHKGLRLHDEEISRLRDTDMKSLLCRKKLYLVLDLDHTLLNSTHLAHLSSEELDLLNQKS